MAKIEAVEGGHRLTIEQGATMTLSVNYTVSDATVDLSSGYVARMQGRSTHASSSTVFNLANGSGITLAASDPNIVITLTASETAALAAPQSGVYDLELEATGGSTIRLLNGDFFVNPEVTR
tara:strand:- start:2731 stop:3096 length:366 start_codon:yes stop_codon:yes gene_type:complete